jgi:hypothetical protein
MRQLPDRADPGDMIDLFAVRIRDIFPTRNGITVRPGRSLPESIA